MENPLIRGRWQAARFTTIDGIEINGVDIIAWNEAGQISSFKVMVRPLKAINMLHRLMAEQLAAAQS